MRKNGTPVEGDIPTLVDAPHAVHTARIADYHKGQSLIGTLMARVAAQFPDKINSLVLAGAPIDPDAGNGPIKPMAQKSPMSFYKQMVATSNGVARMMTSQRPSNYLLQSS